jgi:two-component system NtrC family sensor kinase
MAVSKTRGRALPLLWLLLAAVTVLPAGALAVGGYFIWRETSASSEHDLRRRADIGVENAARVFETHALLLGIMDRMTRNLTDAAITAREAQLHQQLAALIAGVPQVWDLFIWGADGRVLVSARIYPVPESSAAERDYFSALRAGAPEPYVSNVLVGRLDRARFFNVSRRRSGPGPGFNGAIGVSIDPAYFEHRWMETGLADADAGTAFALVREDGVIIARAPAASPANAVRSGSFVAARSADPRSGDYTDVSVVDGTIRRFFYRQVPGLPVYVIGSISNAALQSLFLDAIRPHLWFGIPAAILLIWFVILIIRRTVQAEAAEARANAEQAARAQAEKVVAHAAKLESIGRLAAGLAHDFNNILAATIGGIDLSLRRLRTGRAAEIEPILAQSLAAAHRGADLTKQILAFARGSEGDGEAIQTADVIAEVAALLPPLVGPAIQIETDVPGSLWPVRAPRPIVEAALMNLAVNARDVMPEGGLIRIAAENLRAGPALPDELRRDVDWVRIAVSDTGPGFPDEVRARAFEPFVTTKEVGRGTGLGLAQVYGSARQAGGTARIEDEGPGATVAIYLPRAESPVPEAVAERAAPVAGRPLKLLLVDDDRHVQATAAMALRDAGHYVIEADDAAIALDALRREAGVDVLVVDYAMPGMSGGALAWEVRRLYPSLPMLMVSGQANLDTIDLPPGVTRLPKPFTPDDLVRAVGEIALKPVAA